MMTYPIAIELTVWREFELNQYEIVIDAQSKLSVKRTDDVLHTRELSGPEIDLLIESIRAIQIPLIAVASAPLNQKPSASYEFIIESAHFSLEFNWEGEDLEGAREFQALMVIVELIQGLDKFH